MEIVFIWLACGFIGALIGTSRGGGGCAWFAVGFILGPLGILLALFEGKRCPHCQKKISSKATKCPFCQSEIDR
jgi:hypothetical protein